MDQLNKDSVNRVHDQLQLLSKKENIIEELKKCLTYWNYKLNTSIDNFREDIDQVVDELRSLIFSEVSDERVSEYILCFVHYEIYDHVSSILRNKFTNEDIHVYRISREFCNHNGSPKQLGSTFYNFIPNSAVVELSMLNSKRTPREKLNCLRSSYDNIFAEVKGALISVISKYSEKEIDLPLINNKEVYPIVMAVILKSKLFYFVSDLYYIAQFGINILNEDKHLSEIYQIFEDSLNRIYTKQNSLKSSEGLNGQLSVCDTIKFVEKVTQQKTVMSEEKRRIAKLIVTATTKDLIEDT